ncbi:retrovirus-related Pol polyprotein from transposon 297 [Trichonephila clavipes]|nr:retrovirus-related Pol polyprotein from transposon 297 [Trichonephila clavipes]
MSFGLRNAPSTFQRFINEVLFGLEFVFPYLDDILVASETEEEHKTHLKLVFDLLQKHGLRVNISSQLWDFPDPDLQLALFTDASNFAIGSVLQQFEAGNWKPISFFSKKLTDAQKNYSTYDRELLGIYLSVKKFKHLLEGQNFVIYTDHTPITYAFHQKNEKASPRQLRHLQYISQFSTNICHIKGQDNLVADAFSRIEAITVIDYDTIADKQTQDAELQQFGVPGKIVTDQGRQFESQLFRSLAAICGAKVAHATSYHPQCNGKVERLHRTLKGAIKAHNNIKWTETLPTILLGLRTALRPDTNHTIAQMTFMDDLKPTKSSPPKNQKIFVHKDLKSCTHVFVRVDRVRKALEPPYDGPFPVKERYEKYFTLAIKNKPVNISVDRLKPAYLLMTDSIPDKTTVPCKQSDDTNLLTDVKPTVSRHGRLVKKPLEVSQELGIAQSVISRLWQRFQDDGNVSRCYSTGHPRVTTPNEDRYLAVTAKEKNGRSTALDLSRQLTSATGTTVSRQTVYRRLGHIGLYARRPVRCVPLTATHCHLRLTWSREHASPQQWSCMMFSDESRFSLQSDSRRTLIWKRQVPVTT